MPGGVFFRFKQSPVIVVACIFAVVAVVVVNCCCFCYCCICAVVIANVVAFVYLWLVHSICGTIVAPMFVGAHNFLEFVSVVIIIACWFMRRIRCASFQSQLANRFKL